MMIRICYHVMRQIAGPYSIVSHALTLTIGCIFCGVIGCLFIVAALRSRCGHYIFFRFLLFFLA